MSATNRLREYGATDRGGHHRMTSYQFLATWIRAHAKQERGASLVEYALLVALIAIVCLAAITLLGNNASQTLDSTAQSLS